MVSDNFENKIKSKLEQRTIHPSENSWTKLADKLDDAQKINKTKTKWWLGVAASLIAILLAFLFYFNKTEAINTATEIVNEPLKETLSNPNSQIVIQNNTQEKENRELLEEKTETLKKDNTVKPSSELKEKKLNQTHTIAQLKTSKKDKIIKTNKNTELASNTIAKVEFTDEKQTKSEYDIQKELNSEVDQLLKEAQEDLALSSSANVNAISVNSEMLLKEVEQDIEQSFREKMLKKIISGYDSIKTVIAQRND